MFEWAIETNQIKRVPFADVPVGTGAGGSDVTMAFTERYYDLYDTFKIEATGQ
jgi:hypothetical protein